jgi:hypothetical protein
MDSMMVNDETDEDFLTMESYSDRLLRFQNGPPNEVIQTLLNSINNFFNPEIAKAAQNNCWSLVLIGVHSVALTVSQGLFGVGGEKGFIRYLETFMDGSETGADFSSIGRELHLWRNVLAHQWLASSGHTVGFDTSMSLGWERREETLVLNPARFYDAYRQSFRGSSMLWRPAKILTPDQLQVAKRRLIRDFKGH